MGLLSETSQEVMTLIAGHFVSRAEEVSSLEHFLGLVAVQPRTAGDRLRRLEAAPAGQGGLAGD